jgi:hypothetical protein
MQNTSKMRTKASLSIGAVAGLALVIALGMIAARLPHIVAEFRASPPDAFSDFNYYLYAFTIVLHRPFDAALIYDHDGLIAFLHAMNAQHIDVDSFYAYPPQFALFFSRLALFTPLTAKIIWVLGSVVLFAIGVGLVAKMAYRGEDKGVVVLLVAIALLIHPLLDDLYWGQSNELLFFLLGVTFFMIERGNRYTAGLFLALAVAFKVTPLAIVGLLLLRREWRTVVATVGFSIFIVALTIGKLGVSVVWHYVTSDMSRLNNLNMSIGGAPFNNSVRGALQTLSASGGSPLSASTLGIISLLFSAAVCLLAAALVFKRNEDRRVDYALATATMLAASPMLESVHLVVALIPLFILFGTAFERRGLQLTGWPRVEILLGVLAVLLLMFAPRLVTYTIAILIIYGLCVARYFMPAGYQREVGVGLT